MDSINYAPPTSVVVGSIRALTQATTDGTVGDGTYVVVGQLQNGQLVTIEDTVPST